MMPDMGKFLSTPEVKIDVVISRDIFSAHEVHAGKYSSQYASVSARITLPESVMENARLEDGDAVEVSTGNGSVVVKARTGDDDVAWMSNSPWVNSLLNTPEGDALPSLKLFSAEIKKTQESITPLDSLFAD